MVKKGTHIAFGLAVLPLLVIVLSCFTKPERCLTLSYTLNYPGDSWEKNRTGFLWALSYLGASLPPGSFDKSLTWQDSSTFRLDLAGLGFQATALEALNRLADSLEHTPQYKHRGSIDLGQFVALTIGSSWHYYAITGVPESYSQFLALHNGNVLETFPLLQSTVANHNRRIRFHIGEPVQRSVFIAEEAPLVLGDSGFVPEVYEVMDVMPNGQLRFAIYDAQGQLCAASPRHLGAAGKPAKCLWCHEVVVQPLFRPTDSLQGHMGPAQFQARVAMLNRQLEEYRAGLSSDLNFLNKQDHTYMELLYIAYMEPSLSKLSKEWGISQTVLRQVLQAEQTHQHEEFEFLKDCYSRQSIQRFAPCLWVSGPANMREPCDDEPHYIQPARK